MENGTCRCGCGRATSIATRSRKSRGWIKGQPVPFVRGHSLTAPTSELRLTNLRQAIRERRSGENHVMWKGDAASYRTVHKWMNRQYPRSGVCEECGADGRATCWANIGHTYRRVREDWRELCYPCHREQDYAERD